MPTLVSVHARFHVTVRAPVPPPPLFLPLISSSTRVQTGAVVSPYSPDSNVDVTAEVDEMFQQMEEVRSEPDLEVEEAIGTKPGSALTQQVSGGDATSTRPKTSTPAFGNDTIESPANLSHLESVLNVAITSQADLPVLFSVTQPEPRIAITPQTQNEEDSTSSTCEFPSLPKDNPKVHFLTDDCSESEKTNEDGGQMDCPALYSTVHFGSEFGTEACDESDPSSCKAGPSKSSGSRRPDDQLRELSGSNRAILKTYFDEAKAFNLPLGHPTVVFSEAHMYNLLRVLSDETLRMSYSTI